MKKRRPGALMCCTRKIRHYSFSLFAVATVVTIAPFHALADDKGPLPTVDAVIADEPATAVSEQAATALTVEEGIQPGSGR